MELEEAIEILNNYLCETHRKFCSIGAVGIPNKEYFAIETVLNQITKQEKMVELMTEHLEDNLTDDICNKENCYADEYINGHCQKCLECIKQYFEKKAEEGKIK